jgi:hypothetical protein
MPAIGMGLAWAGYTGMLWAWCLLRGYDVTLGQLVNPVHLLNWHKATGSQIPPGQIMPGGAPPAAAAPSSNGSGGSNAPLNGPCPPGYTMIGGHCVRARAD